MSFNLNRESQSFWKIWKRGTHAQILSEILANDEFHARAESEILTKEGQLELIRAIVRMTGRRIGQELARKGGASNVARDVNSDSASAFSVLESGTADELAIAIRAHERIAKILEEAESDPEEVRKYVNELSFEVSRMTGRALGPLLGLSLGNLLEVAKRIIQALF